MQQRTPFRLLALTSGLLAAATAQGAPAAGDYQRFITFKNDFNFPIYPVIQVPEDNCVAGSTRVRRIIVNAANHKGLASGETATVRIPRIPQDDTREVTLKVDGRNVTQWANCWYRAGRIYIFSVDLAAFEKVLNGQDNKTPFIKGDEDQATQFPTGAPTQDEPFPSRSVDCSVVAPANPGVAVAGDCFTGVAKNSFAADVPAQLAEYTFDSDFPDANPPANTPPADTGRPMADIDVSNVDDLYLPITASVDNGGATGYMGSAMPLADFKAQTEKFRRVIPATKVRRWPIYSAYTSQNWPYNAFKQLVPSQLGRLAPAVPPFIMDPFGVNIAEHMPAMYNMINNTLGPASSSMYTFKDGSVGGNYLVTGMKYDGGTGIRSNRMMQQYLDRWTQWIDTDPCATPAKLIWPDDITGKFNKADFCAKFRENVRTVWTWFTEDEKDGYNHNEEKFRKDCGFGNLTPVPNENAVLKKACILQHIVGYNSLKLDGELPGRVQAALRGVAYEPVDPYPFDSANPGAPRKSTGSQQYQFDPFLTFAAPFDSQFNLDPFTRLIHAKKADGGIEAVAYSFSIDDKYGNFRDEALGFTIDAGGVSALKNQSPYDPYQQYRANWGYNTDLYSLIRLAPGTDLNAIQGTLDAIASRHKRAILIKLEDRLWVFGRAADGSWRLVDLTTRQALQQEVNQEAARNEKNKTNDTFVKVLFDHLFGADDIFPSQTLDPNAVTDSAMGILDWNVDAGWNLSKLKLYEMMTRKEADASTTNNWVSGTFCDGEPRPIATTGSRSLAFPLDNGNYAPCDIRVTDRNGDSLVLRLKPEQFTVEDTYTGAKQKVMGLPHAKQPLSGPLQISHLLNDTDLTYCKANSSAELVTLGLCEAVTLSATWTDERLARDTVYMGLDFVNMPRVNVILQAAPIQGVDPEKPLWPGNPQFAGRYLPDGKTVRLTWAAVTVKSGHPVRYGVTLDGDYRIECDRDSNPYDPTGPKVNLQTSCDVVPKPGSSQPHTLSIVAINLVEPSRQDNREQSVIFTNAPAAFPRP